MARVRLHEDRWHEFGVLAKVKGRTIADYLGWLVQKELNRASRTEVRREARFKELWAAENARHLTAGHPEA
jgi:hypothetical protein